MAEEARNEQSWFQRGDAGFKRSQQIAEDMAKNAKPFRVWLPVGGHTTLTFLDGEGFFYYEHQLKIDGDWKNWFTCRRDFSECPLCDAGDNPTYVAAYTVIDHSEYTSKRTGKKVKNQKRLLVTKGPVHDKWARRIEENGELTYCVYSCARDRKNECNTGEDITFRKRLSRDDVKKFAPEGVDPEEWIQPFHYMEVFKPLAVEELRSIVGQAPVGAEKGNDNNGGGERMPVPETATVADGDASIEDLL